MPADSVQRVENETTFSRFDEMSERYPDAPAIVYLGQNFSYRRLRELSERFAGALNDLGVIKGDRVMIYITNCVQWVIAFLGIQKIGAVIVPVSPIYTSHEIEYMLNDSGAETIICMDTNFCYVQEVMENTGLKRVIVTGLVDLLPSIKRLMGFLFDKVPTGKVDRGPAVHAFKSLLRHMPLQTTVDIDPAKDLSYLLYTGGTTGFPKGVPGNHSGMTSYVNDVTDDVAGDRVQEGNDTYIAVNPLFHIMALGLFMSLGLNKGNLTVLMPKPQVDAILESIQRYRVRWLLGVPALYRMILDNDRLNRYDLSSLRFCFCGGDVLPAEVYNRWDATFDIPIYQVYGSTEVGHVCYSRIDKTPKSGTIGLPLKSRECVIVDPATLEPVAPGESGELLVSSPYTLKGYWNRPDETKRTCVEIDGKVFCRMGDYVSKDQDGELYYVERSADLIKHKGFRVSASEVEAVLQDHATVTAACVVGIPDDNVGERIKAIVVLKEDARGVGGGELIKWCRTRLAAYKVPSYIEFRDMLPKSKVGKLLRREIRDEEYRRLSRQTTRREEMHLWTVLKERRSCRNFLPEAVPAESIEKILEAATWAPSPLNAQPWEFYVVTSKTVKESIHAEAVRCRQWAVGESGWKWLKNYDMDFLLEVPLMIAVVGDPSKSGVDQFMPEGPQGYQHACAAAIQNMLLATHEMGFGSLWFTFFNKAAIAEFLDVKSYQEVIALICIGKAKSDIPPVPRKDVKAKTHFIR
jgi:long-chain acyl-CoA synthetase